MKWLLLVGLVALGVACSGRGDDRPSRSAPDDTPTAAASDWATPTATAAPEHFALGAPITSADATASIPVERDGRRLSVVAGLGDEVLVDAEKDVPYLPGEVVGQGRKAADQQFLFWNPATGTFREAWVNQSKRIESVFDIDGDWVISLLYTINPGADWTLRLRNLATGEVRDIDEETDLEPGLGAVQIPTAIADGRVVYTRYSGTGMTRTSEVRLYDIAAGTFEVLDSAEYSLENMSEGSVLGNVSIDGETVAWSRQGKLYTPIGTVIRNLRTGQERIFSDIKVGPCQLVQSAPWLACNTSAALRGPAGSPIVSAYVRLSDNRVFPAAADGIPYSHTWNGWSQLHVGGGGPSRFSIIQPETFLVRVLDAPNVGSTPRLVDGWFTWIEFARDGDGNRDWANSVLRVLLLP